jgi:2-polyprenyl-3-methyl-5-hydroxy-6-metoxy-1,4-benzoquinol methylase
MWDWQEISGGGERVSHLYRNDCFYAHLSLYRYAARFVEGAAVLDAGCGAGYGSVFLADHGAASVRGIDVDAEAIDFSRSHFERPNLTFEVMDLQQMIGFEPQSLDLIIASNILEHVPDVTAFLRVARGLLRPSGVLVVAVPPVVDEQQRMRELANRYHLNIWSPAQWLHALAQFFGDVEVREHFLARADVQLDFRNKPEDTVITQEDFVFPVVDGTDLDSGSLTALFTASRPLGAAEVPAADEALSFIDDSITRRAPLLPPLEPEALEVKPRPLHQLPLRAIRLLGALGIGGLASEARRYLVWRARRVQSLRAQRNRRGK